MLKILVPTDFSKYSNAALCFAASIVRKKNGEICLLHVLEVPEMSSGFPENGEWSINSSDSASETELISKIMEEARKNMKELRESPYLEDINLMDNIEMGEVEVLVNSAVSRFSADLIILGAHKSSNPFELFNGSQVEKIVRSSEVPVLTVKKNYPRNISNIVFASNFDDEIMDIFPKLIDFSSARPLKTGPK
mgnify:CR=1 FL=1